MGRHAYTEAGAVQLLAFCSPAKGTPNDATEHQHQITRVVVIEAAPNDGMSFVLLVRRQRKGPEACLAQQSPSAWSREHHLSALRTTPGGRDYCDAEAAPQGR